MAKSRGLLKFIQVCSSAYLDRQGTTWSCYFHLRWEGSRKSSYL